MIQSATRIPVLYTYKYENDFLIPLLVYKAELLEDGQVLIMDYLSRGATLTITKKEFKEQFVQMTENDFIEYQRAINNGNVGTSNALLRGFKNKYVAN